MKFVLILTLFGYDGPDFWYVINSSLTGVECVQMLEKQHNLLSQTFYEADFNLSCEVDHANDS